MIDPIHSLSFSIHSNKGVYAVLLGSGISRSAKIPTGWEVTLDLVRKLAAISGEPCDPSPAEWYRAKFNRDPDYSVLLATLAKTPSERQQLLRGYWEPTDLEREEGAKLPTAAHQAIASLVEQGFIRIIITTNFDRLMEAALADVGITPTVLSIPDQVHGTLPLIHTRCCVFKVHGDYLDTRILNTPEELASYPPEFDALLDRIFDEFGLIVCGWSADWDEALRRAIFRTPCRRFATYWAAHGEPSSTAQQLIAHRNANVINIDGSDSFFQALQQQVQSLEEFSRPHPLSIEAAVTSLKRYLSEPRFRIQLDDLVSCEIDRIIAATSGPKFSVTNPVPDLTNSTARARTYEAVSSTMVAMATIGGRWVEEQHYTVWQRALERLVLAIPREVNGTTYIMWAGLQRYPATLLLYTLGIASLEAGCLQFLGKLFSTQIHLEYQEPVAVVTMLPPCCMFEDSHVARQLEGMERRHAPMNDWIHNFLRPQFKQTFPSDKRFTLLFDKLEILMAMSCAYHSSNSGSSYWAPPGAFGYRHSSRDAVLKEIQESIEKKGEQSPYISSGIFGTSVETCNDSLKAFKSFIAQIRWY
ncbi:SIR2 family protein [Geomonas anaerohicana]|uniref:SIR2 family protein n=1 Tax=Geomonas anaerohicana TaxID=2798583 RepID=A0ABS0YGB9_9BACT|nr:SIR2 family protein [Geomonas anaerohicana]MBJ6751345.1 SIR2 family protein [Geomonas anaerohicana]